MSGLRLFHTGAAGGRWPLWPGRVSRARRVLGSVVGDPGWARSPLVRGAARVAAAGVGLRLRHVHGQPAGRTTTLAPERDDRARDGPHALGRARVLGIRGAILASRVVTLRWAMRAERS